MNRRHFLISTAATTATTLAPASLKSLTPQSEWRILRAPYYKGDTSLIYGHFYSTIRNSMLLVMIRIDMNLREKFQISATRFDYDEVRHARTPMELLRLTCTDAAAIQRTMELLERHLGLPEVNWFPLGQII